MAISLCCLETKSQSVIKLHFNTSINPNKTRELWEKKKKILSDNVELIEIKPKYLDEFTYARNNNTDFRESEWYKMHIKTERHHINDYVQENVDLIDVLEMIADCTSAGLARSGDVREITIDKDVLYKAFQNTCKLVKDMCVLEK